MPRDHLAELNKQQRRAVLHGRKLPKMICGPLLVIAGAGSRKDESDCCSRRRVTVVRRRSKSRHAIYGIPEGGA